MSLFSDRVAPGLGNIANCVFWVGKSSQQSYAGSAAAVVSFDIPFFCNDPTSLGFKNWDSGDSCFVVPDAGLWAFGGSVISNHTGDKIVTVSFKSGGGTAWGDSVVLQRFKGNGTDVGMVALGASLLLDKGDRARLEYINSDTTAGLISVGGEGDGTQFFGVKLA